MQVCATLLDLYRLKIESFSNKRLAAKLKLCSKIIAEKKLFVFTVMVAKKGRVLDTPSSSCPMERSR